MEEQSSASTFATYTMRNKIRRDHVHITYYLVEFEQQLVKYKINIKYSEYVIIAFLCST
jgi:hypothetical protein